jgi:hypothetical protein
MKLRTTVVSKGTHVIVLCQLLQVNFHILIIPKLKKMKAFPRTIEIQLVIREE